LEGFLYGMEFRFSGRVFLLFAYPLGRLSFIFCPFHPMTDDARESLHSSYGTRAKKRNGACVGEDIIGSMVGLTQESGRKRCWALRDPPFSSTKEKAEARTMISEDEAKWL
jgi:hypothetical protein